MANRYWVGGTGTWNTTSTTNWSASSGGASGASVPTDADSVFFDQAGTYTVAMTGALACLDITVSAGTVTFATGTTPTLSVAGSMTLLAGTVWNSTGTTTFTSTTTGRTVTTNGVTLNGSVTFNGTGGGWTLGSALTLAAARTITLTAGALNLDTYTLTTGLFNYGNINARTLTFGTGLIALIGTGAVWSGTSSSGLSVTGSRVIYVNYNGASTISVAASSQSFNFYFTAGTYALTIASGLFRDLNFTGFAGTVSNTAISISGNLNLGSTATFTSGASAWSFVATSTGKTITSNSKIFRWPVIFNGVGGSWILQDAMTLNPNQSTTLTAGTLDLQSYTLTTGVFLSSNSTTRTIAFGTGNITITGDTTTIWNTGTITNLTVTGTPVVNVSTSGLSAMTVSSGSLSEANSINFNFTTGTYNITLTAGTKRDLNFTGFAGTVSNTAQTIYGNLNLGSTATFTSGATAWVFAATSTGKTITSNGKTMTFPATFNGVGGTWVLQDALTMGSNRTLTHTNGTIDLNGKTLTVGSSYTTATGTKNLTFNGGTLVCPANTPAAFSNVAPTGFTTTAGTGTGTISMTGSAAKSFAGGGSTFNCTLNQGGAGTLNIEDANTFNNITNTVQPATVAFPGAVTTTFNNFNLNGTAGNLISLTSTAPGTRATLSKASGTVSCNYISITDSAATGGASWYAGANSVNNGNNTGWIFTAPPTPGGNTGAFFSIL